MTPDKIKCYYGLEVKEKIIPWGWKWFKHWGSYWPGDAYKSDKYMAFGVEGITIHNTDYINDKSAERYVEATFNQNMGDARVHYFIDKTECWQTLLDNEIGWHAGTGDLGSGNRNTIAIEIIMNGEVDQTTMTRGAFLCAYLLNKYNLPISKVFTHKHWNNKQCPYYILPQWDNFIKQVKEFKEKMAIECEAIKRYKHVSDIDSPFYTPTINKLVEKGLLKGRDANSPDDPEIDLTEDTVRTLVILDRMGIFDK